MVDEKQLLNVNLEVKDIIKQLENEQLYVKDVPEEIALNMEIVRTERKLGLRKSGNRGFDVIKQEFFVEEEWLHKNYMNEIVSNQHTMIFESFEEYYNFLDGDIYENACYYQYNFKDTFSKGQKLDVDRLNAKRCFVSESIDDYANEVSQKELDEYNHCERNNKRRCKQWIERFNACNTHKELKRVCDKYVKYDNGPYLKFLFFQYAFYAPHDKKRLNAIMEYLSNNSVIGGSIVQGLCLIYNPEDVINKYDCGTSVKQKKKIKDLVADLKNGDVETKVCCYFDESTHYYIEQTRIYRYMDERGRRVFKEDYSSEVSQAFETFEKFIEYRNGDLRNCDLSGAFDLDIDFSQFKTDATTKLPLGKNNTSDYEVKKEYLDGKFNVEQIWYYKTGQIAKELSHSFKYFFDFLAFLKGDLSGANLVFCEGMRNLLNVEGINLKDAKLTSQVCEQFDIPYITYRYDRKLIREFPLVEENEKQTALELQKSREVVVSDDIHFFEKNIRISYISDLHLMHRIQNAECKSEEDIIYIMQKIIDNILNDSTELTLIGGDVSSEFSVFELFVKMLRKSADKKHKTGSFIFVLGNHELWKFSELSIEQIVEKYRKLLKNHDMYLLHNELFYSNELDEKGIISYNELMDSENTVISEKLRCSRLAILGGLGFSGYNEEFNANQGVYRDTVDRDTEIQESKKFENLYNKLLDVLDKKNTIIFTHTPKKDWCREKNYRDNYVYVSGHTHRNEFFDDGVERVYADNQIGYGNENPCLKNFLIDSEYDYFVDYENGIYEITSQEYRDFARGKNVNMTFNRQINILYMLKKNGWYCFIHKGKNGSLSILDGGALKRLDKKDIQYYYDNMDTIISTIKKPLDRYMAYQEGIANEIKKIGGSGRIHGCIIDINFFNHIFINPVNMAVTGYYAADAIYKVIYPNVPTLLEAECTELYSNYLKLIEVEKSNPLMEKQKKNDATQVQQAYLETDIYKASREMKKLQKLNYNILTTWHDIIPDKNVLPYNN